MTIIVVTLMLANPFISLAVNQMISPPELTQTKTIQTRNVLKCFPFTVKDIMTVLEE
jgi:hypothetical protein